MTTTATMTTYMAVAVLQALADCVRPGKKFLVTQAYFFKNPCGRAVFIFLFFIQGTATLSRKIVQRCVTDMNIIINVITLSNSYYTGV